MPFLGDWRAKKPEDVDRMERATCAAEQIKIMKDITNFEVWNGERWVSSLEMAATTYHIQGSD